VLDSFSDARVASPKLTKEETAAAAARTQNSTDCLVLVSIRLVVRSFASFVRSLFGIVDIGVGVIVHQLLFVSVRGRGERARIARRNCNCFCSELLSAAKCFWRASLRFDAKALHIPKINCVKRIYIIQKHIYIYIFIYYTYTIIVLSLQGVNGRVFLCCSACNLNCIVKTKTKHIYIYIYTYQSFANRQKQSISSGAIYCVCFSFVLRTFFILPNQTKPKKNKEPAGAATLFFLHTIQTERHLHNNFCIKTPFANAQQALQASRIEGGKTSGIFLCSMLSVFFSHSERETERSCSPLLLMRASRRQN